MRPTKNYSFCWENLEMSEKNTNILSFTGILTSDIVNRDMRHVNDILKIFNVKKTYFLIQLP